MSVPGSVTVPVPAAAPDDGGGLLEGRAAWEAALWRWLDDAVAGGARELWWSDADFAAWPLGERAWIERLSAWAAPRRELVVLCARPEALLLAHPRWASWRRTWAHLVSLWWVDAQDAGALPQAALVAGGAVLKALPGKVMRAQALSAGPDARRLEDVLRTIRGRSAPGSPAQVLGL